MAYGKIGTRGTNKGPSKTTMTGSIKTGNLGRKAGMKTSGGPNKDASKAIARGRVNPGPGGSARP